MGCWCQLGFRLDESSWIAAATASFESQVL